MWFFFRVSIFFWKMKIFKSPQLFFREFPAQTVDCSRCRKSWIFQKWRFRRVALRCSMWNHTFFIENVIFDENLWFLKKIFCSKLSKNHSEFERRKKKDVSKPDSRIEKSHQIEPNYMINLQHAPNWTYHLDQMIWH